MWSPGGTSKTHRQLAPRGPDDLDDQCDRILARNVVQYCHSTSHQTLLVVPTRVLFYDPHRNKWSGTRSLGRYGRIPIGYATLPLFRWTPNFGRVPFLLGGGVRAGPQGVMKRSLGHEFDLAVIVVWTTQKVSLPPTSHSPCFAAPKET